jgi:tetratricopeptide (TPR) repeat protein
MLSAVIFGIAITLSAAKADEVTVRTGPNTVRRVTGEIVEYNAEVLMVQRTGRKESFEPITIESFVTTWPASYTEGRKKMASSQWQEAIVDLREAVADESRLWAQRQIIADTVRCYAALGEYQKAAATFKVIYRNTPITRHLSVLPIQWWVDNSNAAELETLKSWLRDIPPLKLAAASRLLTSPLRREAQQALQDLVLDTNPRIAILATCQLWRDEVVQATPETVARWEEKLQRLSPDLRTGPAYVVAATLARQGDWQDAAELFLRCPILFGNQHELAAQSLLAAAGSLEKLDRHRQAATLYREIIARFPKSKCASQSQQLLSNLDPS